MLLGDKTSLAVVEAVGEVRHLAIQADCALTKYRRILFSSRHQLLPRRRSRMRQRLKVFDSVTSVMVLPWHAISPGWRNNLAMVLS